MSNIPIIKQVAWISIIPQILVIMLFIFLWRYINPEKAGIYGAMTYLIVSQILKSTVAKFHRGGMSCVKTESFNKAIDYFEKSYNFFSRYQWIDKYRYITLLSSSKMTYKEMALSNIAFSYSQINEGKKAEEYYNKLLEEYPNNSIAKTALKMIKSFENQ